MSRSHRKRLRWAKYDYRRKCQLLKGGGLHKLEAQASLSQREFMRIINMIKDASLPLSKGGLEGM